LFNNLEFDIPTPKVHEMLVTTLTALTSATTMTSAISLGLGGVLVAILLILFPSSRELITASSKKSKRILSSLDAIIFPLSVAFALTVAFQVIQVLTPIS